MAGEYSPENFVESAREFARTALVAHRERQHRRLAIDAGTALEHLAKACLASRSPGLLSELRGEDSFGSLLQLLGIPGAQLPRRMRTVGNRTALARVKQLVPSKASEADLATIIDMRDGIVHAAQGEEVEDRLVVAFVRHADALLKDLGERREVFWGRQVSVVDALLADASNKTKHRVQVKMAAARARYRELYGDAPDELVSLIERLAGRQPLMTHQIGRTCPVCEAHGPSTGEFEVDWFPGVQTPGSPMGGVVFHRGHDFMCTVCGFHAETADEMDAAGMGSDVELPEADPAEYDTEGPWYGDAIADIEYERRRDEGTFPD